MDQCRRCTFRGDMKRCLIEDCNIHDSWYVQMCGPKSPFCLACKEPDCCVSTDGTCALLRVYLDAKYKEATDGKK